MNAKEKSRAYFNAHRKSRLARGGYWRADYRHVMKEIERFRPASLIDIGCGPGGFLCAVQKRFPDIQLNSLDLSEEMVRETQERLGPSAVAIVGDSEHMPLESEQYEVVTCNMSIHHYPHAQDAVNEMLLERIAADVEGEYRDYINYNEPTSTDEWFSLDENEILYFIDDIHERIQTVKRPLRWKTKSI